MNLNYIKLILVIQLGSLCAFNAGRSKRSYNSCQERIEGLVKLRALYSVGARASNSYRGEIKAITETALRYALILTGPLAQIVVGFLIPAAPGPNCQLELDAIFGEIEKVSKQVEGLEFLIECEFVKSRFYELRLRIETLSDVIRTKNKQNIRCHCNDRSEGLRKIISAFKYFLGEMKQLNTMIRTCAKYESELVKMWAHEMTQISKSITTFVLICDAVNERNNTFDTNIFAQEVKSIVDYAAIELVYQFMNDNSSVGLQSKVREHTRNADTASDLTDVLNKKYAFLDWDALVMPKYGFLKRYWYGISNENAMPWTGRSINCGAIYYGPDEEAKSAVVAWSAKEFHSRPSKNIENLDWSFLKGRSTFCQYWNCGVYIGICGSRPTRADYFANNIHAQYFNVKDEFIFFSGVSKQ